MEILIYHTTTLFDQDIFAGYTIMTILTVIHLWSKDSKSRTILSVGHINNIPKKIKMQHQPLENPANYSPHKTSP